LAVPCFLSYFLKLLFQFLKAVEEEEEEKKRRRRRRRRRYMVWALCHSPCEGDAHAMLSLKPFF
jgi:hypothetical protein